MKHTQTQINTVLFFLMPKLVSILGSFRLQPGRNYPTELFTLRLFDRLQGLHIFHSMLVRKSHSWSPELTRDKSADLYGPLIPSHESDQLKHRNRGRANFISYLLPRTSLLSGVSTPVQNPCSSGSSLVISFMKTPVRNSTIDIRTYRPSLRICSRSCPLTVRALFTIT